MSTDAVSGLLSLCYIIRTIATNICPSLWSLLMTGGYPFLVTPTSTISGVLWHCSGEHRDTILIAAVPLYGRFIFGKAVNWCWRLLKNITMNFNTSNAVSESRNSVWNIKRKKRYKRSSDLCDAARSFSVILSLIFGLKLDKTEPEVVNHHRDQGLSQHDQSSTSSSAQSSTSFVSLCVRS